MNEPVSLLSFDGQERFSKQGVSIGLTIFDFWQFQFSNIYDLQEHIAEFLVAKALDIDKPYNRSGWTPFDILLRGTRIEVKETGYFYSWQEDGKTSNRRSFRINQTYNAKHIKERQNDIYVFCLNTGETAEDSNPLELEHWEFYVIPTKTINEECGNNKTISLSKVQRLTNKVTFSEIKECIDDLLDKMS